MPKTPQDLPPMNALRTFSVAGRRLNFRAAAEELGVTQGAVAQQIKLLEGHIGLSLFTRLPRGVALTPDGSAYYAEIQRAFMIMHEATEQIREGGKFLTISVTPTFATKLLIPNLQSLNSALPGIEIRTIATVAVTDFDRDQVDIVIRETRPPFPANQEAKLLFNQDLILVGGPNVIKGLTLPLAPELIRTLPLLHDSYTHWNAYFRTDAKLPGPRFNQISLALDAASAGQGLAIVSRSFVQSELTDGRLIEVGPAGYEPDAGYYLIRKKRWHMPRSIDAFWYWCLDTFTAR
ncbi:LysR substrate-binding domain-containing protein [Peteryoungia algae]|uniref:LysR substrate-binding domain-containing protein n=1 Tax=Peteryoungia algae TaxID=2919917 RepID=A0ABT0D5Y9_9HYPH|nr:LysR substrate-binding domain-containing protein [Rhizobium sp. SSM4.3]MCJ8240719.1 LysR substrate-binding domain-containing protein [Rhizobium sp. SSM4.3]